MTTMSDPRDVQHEYASDDWAKERGYELATSFGNTQDERMAQADDIAQALIALRDHYEANRRAQPASNAAGVERWQPVEDCNFEWFSVEEEGSQLAVWCGDDVPYMEVQLPDNIRLCRLTDSPQPPAMALTDLKQMLYEAISIYQKYIDNDYQTDYAESAAVKEVLSAQKGATTNAE